MAEAKRNATAILKSSQPLASIPQDRKNNPAPTFSRRNTVITPMSDMRGLCLRAIRALQFERWVSRSSFR